jgi:hypothetical protein
MEDDRKIDVEVVCPQCRGKAILHSKYVGSYELFADPNGRATCIQCGYIGAYKLTKQNYWHQISIRKHVLYAWNYEHLMMMRNYLGYTIQPPKTDPELDYPRWIYEYRLELIEKIDKHLADKK